MKMLQWLLVLVVAHTAKAQEADSFGRYDYDRYGYRVYRYCFDRYARPENQCKSGYGRGVGYPSSYYNDPYINRYDDFSGRNNANTGTGTGFRDNDYYGSTGSRNGVYAGKGRFREYGADVELICEFPRGTNIVSNIVWERVPSSPGDRRYPVYQQDWMGSRMQVRRIGDYGSKLIINGWDERDRGEYRCTASRSSTGYSRYSDTVYMVVDFYPPGYGPGYSDYSRYNNYDSHFSRDSYYPNYRSLLLTATKEKIVSEDEHEKDIEKTRK
ncbi:uncharacterized protein LOC111695068 isoform X2 [Eurytemora carolleeae]|uniref:uncharacterized protein LOC111695068 isoform X2 n=1 Tax=Eurytemora carolleeae TaxID=1294199 RepID=UPI000C764C75|nr:uncharacterized protein LOC111695068 isoform X2 [Eurytemora carolleeae]|eukprot:XP_023319999.1 uncharacterized protein LOC111695068 isoform X2 [Eurytemora affinis]